jgi:phosphoribosylformylglycinamidine synthase subunit PurS
VGENRVDRRKCTSSHYPLFAAPALRPSIFLAPSQIPGNMPASRKMKAKIVVTPKKAVLDPQGKTVQNALEHMGYKGVQAVHVGKYLEVELAGGDKEAARKQIDEACRKFLTNPVIEDFHLEITD